MTEVGTEARGTLGWDRSVTKRHPPRLFLRGRRTRFKGHLFSIGLSAVVEKVGKQKVLRVSPNAQEVLRAGRKALWCPLGLHGHPPGLECDGEEHSQAEEGAQEVRGAPRVYVAAASHMAHLREGHPHRAPPPQMPTSCFLPAWRKAAQLSFSIFPNSWLPPQLPPGPTVEPDGLVPSPRGSWDPVYVPAAGSVPLTLTPSCVHPATLCGGEPSALRLLKRSHCAWGPGPSWATERWPGDPVHLSFCIQPAPVHRLVGRRVSQGWGSCSSGVVGWVQLRPEASLWAPPQLTVGLPEDGLK